MAGDMCVCVSRRHYCWKDVRRNWRDVGDLKMRWVVWRHTDLYSISYMYMYMYIILNVDGILQSRIIISKLTVSIHVGLENVMLMKKKV